MPSLFDEIEAASQAAIDAVFGDGNVRIVPQAQSSNYWGGSDPARMPMNIRATFSAAPMVGKGDYPDTRRDGSDLSLAPAELWIERGAAAAIPYTLKRGDKIEISRGSGGPRIYTIAVPEYGDHGDIRILLA